MANKKLSSFPISNVIDTDDNVISVRTISPGVYDYYQIPAKILGTVWTFDTVVPADNIGKDGDFFMNESNYDIYERTMGTWNPIGNISGPKGDAGNSWNVGALDPISKVNDGDMYLNISNFNLFTFKNNAWIFIGNIKGLKGEIGHTGSNGAKGDTGSAGAKGDTGSAGTIITSGSIVPNDNNNNNGDYYIDTTTFDIYLKTSNHWNVIGNIKGTNGTNGTSGTNSISQYNLMFVADGTSTTYIIPHSIGTYPSMIISIIPQTVSIPFHYVSITSSDITLSFDSPPPNEFISMILSVII